jgi:hypothetical protein
MVAEDVFVNSYGTTFNFNPITFVKKVMIKTSCKTIQS